ncbi:hypothetical protein BG000_003951 [Podila horticola]|nr:hypothetical protein BG000_003951 [Podila horticola]
MYGQQKTPEQQRQLYASFYHDAASVNMDTMPGLTHSVDTDDMDMNSKPPEEHVRNIQAYGRVLKRDGDLRQQQQDHRMAEQQQQLEYNQKNLHQPQSHQPSSSFYRQQQFYQQHYQQQQQQQQFYYQQQQVQQPQSRQQRQQQQPEQQRQQERQQQQQPHPQPSRKPITFSYNSPTEDSSAMPSLTFSEDPSSSSSMLSASGPGAIPGNLTLPPHNQPERGVDDNEFFLTSILDMINNTPPATGPGSMNMIPHFDYQSCFTQRQMIAKGGNGEVRRAFWPMRNCYVILKSLIDTKHSATKLAVMFDKEVEVMNRCGSHDNLAQFYGIATKPADPGSPTSSLETDRFMVMQYYEHGDLVQLLAKSNFLPEAPTLIDKLYLAMDIAVGLDHLYKCGFHHGDLHPKNILIDSRQNVMYPSSASVGASSGGRYLARLTDFGLRRIRDHTDKVSSQPFGGVWQFMAPERMVKNRPRYNVRCDIFALGVIYWQIMSGRYPFKDPKTYSPGAREPRPEDVPDWYYEVYTRAWSENPLERQQYLEEIVAVFRHHLGIASMTSGTKSMNPNHPRYKKSHVPNGMLGRSR